MINKDIIHHRLLNQRIAQSDFTKPEQVVAHLGAMRFGIQPVFWGGKK